MSTPSKTIRPALGSMSRRSSRPTVVLPQPDSPTRPSVSPRAIVRSTPIDRLHLGDGALEQSRPDREDLAQSLDPHERLGVAARGRGHPASVGDAGVMTPVVAPSGQWSGSRRGEPSSWW